MNLCIDNLRQQYLQGTTIESVMDYVLEKSSQWRQHNIWIHMLSREEIQAYITRLNSKSPESLPLYGIPFAIKDNIDLAHAPTTAACAEFAYIPEQHAHVVQLLIDAGAIPIGKTNMDQFATGLVGTRSPQPWGACANVFDKDYISGGSSSGSAVAVAAGIVSFSLGTDTAGSGRVPAAFNNIVGLKPTKGLISTRGVVPACRSLDCVSIFALNTDDIHRVFDVVAQYDDQDDYARENSYANNFRHYANYKSTFCYGVPKESQLEFFGNTEYAELFRQACRKMNELGGQAQEINFEPFLQAAKLLYEGPWVAERYVAIESIIQTRPECLLPEIRTIIGGAEGKFATDAYKAFYQLQHHYAQSRKILDQVDFLLIPTTGQHYTQAEVKKDPITLNSNLGYYTNFMNLLDCCGVALPAGFTRQNLPFGITVVSTAYQDQNLLSFARCWQKHIGLKLGNTVDYFSPENSLQKNYTESTVDLVVCGAHLEGFPLNWQLTERKAILVRATTSAAKYCLYDLGGEIPRPAMVRCTEGQSIRVEVWRMPKHELGSFVAEIPAPLGIGKVELQDGQVLPGFICEANALQDAKEISQYGGWAAYINSHS